MYIRRVIKKITLIISLEAKSYAQSVPIRCYHLIKAEKCTEGKKSTTPLTAFVNEFVFTRLTFSKLSFQHIYQKRRAPILCYSLEKRGWVHPGGILGLLPVRLSQKTKKLESKTPLNHGFIFVKYPSMQNFISAS